MSFKRCPSKEQLAAALFANLRGDCCGIGAGECRNASLRVQRIDDVDRRLPTLNFRNDQLRLFVTCNWNGRADCWILGRDEERA